MEEFGKLDILVNNAGVLRAHWIVDYPEDEWDLVFRVNVKGTMLFSQAAAKQMVSMIWAGGYAEEKPGAVPYGGREAVLHTNPLALGFPAGDESPMIVDYATSAASGVKIEAGCGTDRSGPPEDRRSGGF